MTCLGIALRTRLGWIIAVGSFLLMLAIGLCWRAYSVQATAVLLSHECGTVLDDSATRPIPAKTK
jgi:hypothetical protein